MAALIVGTYDASTFVEGDYATYPALPAGVTYYQMGMAWEVTVAGTVHGQAVVPGDLLFAMPRPRRYADLTYGAKVYGSKDIDSNDWLVDEVVFLKWDGNALPPDQIPYPNAGCPLTPEHGFNGEWAPGWRIVVDCYYNPKIGSRRYGELNYGDELFGTTEDAVGAHAQWVDITQPSFHIEIGDGMADGGPRVVVSEVVISFLDPAGFWFDMAVPQTWRQPQPGVPIRVGLVDPLFRYHPLITAEIERIEDKHDADIREVSVRGFGKIIDLVVDLPSVQRPVEKASARFKWLASAAGWSWDSGDLVFPSGDSYLLADNEVRPVVVARDEMDRTCMSVGWSLDSDRKGRMRVRTWPLGPVGLLHVADCHGYFTPDEPPTNAATNPGAVNNGAWRNRHDGNAGTATVSWISDGNGGPANEVGGTWRSWARKKWTVAASPAMGRNGFDIYNGPGQGDWIPLRPGWLTTVSIQVRVVGAYPRVMRLALISSTGASLGFVQRTLTSNAWQKMSLTVRVPTDVLGARVIIEAATVAQGGTPWGVNDQMDATALAVTTANPGGLPMPVSHSISFANDESQLLNYVLTANTADPPVTVLAEESVSVGRFGRRGRAHNFPQSGLAWSDAATAQGWTRRVMNRYAFITRQVEAFEVDTAVDQNWLKALVDMDTGHGVRVNRMSLTPMSFDGVIVGWRYRIDPGRWQATMFVATTTPS